MSIGAETNRSLAPTLAFDYTVNVSRLVKGQNQMRDFSFFFAVVIWELVRLFTDRTPMNQ